MTLRYTTTLILFVNQISGTYNDPSQRPETTELFGLPMWLWSSSFNLLLTITSSTKMELININDSASTSLAILLVARILLISGLTAYLWDWFPSKAAKTASAIRKYYNGPKPWPILGNIGVFARLARNPDKELVRLAKKYGGVCMLWLSSTPVMIISRAEDAKRLLDKVGFDQPQRNQIFTDRASRKDLSTQIDPGSTHSGRKHGHGV